MNLSKMLEVNDLEVSTMLVRNSIALDMPKRYSQVMKYIKDNCLTPENVKIDLTMEEWNCINTINWFFYEYLCKKFDTTRNIIEKSSIEKFLDHFESAVMKINDCC